MVDLYFQCNFAFVTPVCFIMLTYIYNFIQLLTIESLDMK